VNGIDLGQDMRRLSCKRTRPKAPEIVRCPNGIEDSVHFPIDIFGITEPVAVFSGSDRAGLPGPVIDILEKMMMQGLVVSVV
jgi:hypothetical protein